MSDIQDAITKLFDDLAGRAPAEGLHVSMQVEDDEVVEFTVSDKNDPAKWAKVKLSPAASKELAADLV